MYVRVTDCGIVWRQVITILAGKRLERIWLCIPRLTRKAMRGIHELLVKTLHRDIHLKG